LNRNNTNNNNKQNGTTQLALGTKRLKKKTQPHATPLAGWGSTNQNWMRVFSTTEKPLAPTNPTERVQRKPSNWRSI